MNNLTTRDLVGVLLALDKERNFSTCSKVPGGSSVVVSLPSLVAVTGA